MTALKSLPMDTESQAFVLYAVGPFILLHSYMPLVNTCKLWKGDQLWCWKTRW